MEPSSRALRRFGLQLGGFFVLFGAGSWWRGHAHRAFVFWAIGATLVLVALVAPRALAGVERGWMRLGERLGQITAPIVLSVLYYLLVTPIGFVIRRFRDPLDRALADGRDSEWIPRETGPVDVARYRDQF